MIKFVSVNEMREIEKEAASKGLSYAQMMTFAGEALARVINNEFPLDKDKGALGMVGPGNNGGDTLVALAWLAENGWIASAFLMKPRTDDDPLILRFQRSGGRIFASHVEHEFGSLHRLIQTHGVLIDGLLGTGTQLPLKPAAAELLSTIKKSIQDHNPTIKIVAVDCPSGVDCDTGAAAPETITAQITVTMAAVKHGILNFPAYSHVGKLNVVEIGLPGSGDGLNSWNAVKSFVPDSAYIQKHLPVRPLDSHKGTFGTTLISAGCSFYPGAAFLSGKAAYLVGTGLVTMAVPVNVHSILAGNFPEATWLPLPEESGFVSAEASRILVPELSRASAFLVGPGFGLQKTSQDFILQVLAGNDPVQIDKQHPAWKKSDNSHPEFKLPPVIIDADALKLIASNDRWWTLLPPNSILTPHPGEMATLSGLTKTEIQTTRLNVAQKYSALWGHVLVLKGAFTVVANPDGLTAVIPVATSALARAGTGDVLAGLIASLRAQGVDAFIAAVLGAWIHAYAGIRAEKSLGNPASVLATDVLTAIPSVISELIHSS